MAHPGQIDQAYPKYEVGRIKTKLCERWVGETNNEITQSHALWTVRLITSCFFFNVESNYKREISV